MNPRIQQGKHVQFYASQLSGFLEISDSLLFSAGRKHLKEINRHD